MTELFFMILELFGTLGNIIAAAMLACIGAFVILIVEIMAREIFAAWRTERSDKKFFKRIERYRNDFS